MNVLTYFVQRVLSIFLVASLGTTPALHAQTPTAPAVGTSVAVRLIDAVNSANDAAGKQYRASVTKAVDAGNGETIALGAVAGVRLVNSGNGSAWTTQLVSVAINGQPVAVASSSVSAESEKQNAAKLGVGAMSSALASLGHHVNASALVTPVATGPQVTLPKGTILSFVLAQPPAPSPLVAAAQPAIASAAPAHSTASGPAAISGAGGALTAMDICFSNTTPFAGPYHNTEYLTAVVEAPLDAQGRTPDLAAAFTAYLKATYQARLNVTCQSIWSTADAQSVQKKIASDHSPTVKLVDTGWRYGQPPLAQGQSGFDPLAQGPAGLDLAQHRLTTYFCSLIAKGGTTMAQTDPALANQVDYVSPVFLADWDAGAVDRAFDVYIRDHYVHDLSLLDTTTRCGAQSPALQPGMHQRAMISSADNGHVVPVDFTDTPAQAAAGNAAASQMAAAAATAPKLGPGEYYLFCYSDPSAPLMYFSEVFVGKTDRTDIRGTSFRIIGNNFLVFLQHKYSFKSSAQCSGGTIESAPAQGQKQKLEDQYRKANKQIVETGWKNAS